MDVHNVSSQYGDLLIGQKKTLEEAKKRQGQRPRDRKSREHTYTKFMMHLMSQDITLSDSKSMISSSFIPPSYLPCSTSMSELNPITIKYLQLETHHRGTYLLLRSITPPNRMTAIMAVMEDEDGDVILLTLYQQEDERNRAAVDIVKVGTILLVKEPYFKVMGDGEYGLRVDHLSDVIHLTSGDARIPKAWQPRRIKSELSAESLKTRGNISMGKKKYWDAITEYSDALNQPATEKEIETIKRNRSLAFLKTKQLDAALADTGYPNFSLNPAEKALFRAAEALYKLRQFSECCHVLEQLRMNFPHNSEASAFLERAQSRVVEQKTGVYNFSQLQENAKKLRPPHLDHATYIGPVEVRQTESKGRGLFVTKDVKAGDLLLCEKAFSHAHAGEGAADAGNDEASSTISILLNPETGGGFMGTQADLIKLTVQKLYRNPSLAPAFTTLYHGSYERGSTSTVDGEPIVDTFLVERIISFNVFGCPVSSLASHIESRDQHSPLASKSTESEAHHSCGIWTHASYINHCCTSNARRSFIGDMMIVRASCDIKADSEVTFWYHSPSPNEKGWQEKFKHWGFVCGCAICLDARATDPVVHSKREKLLGDLHRLCSSSSTPAGSAVRRVEIKKIERLIATLNQSYTRPAKDVPRLLIWDPQLMLVWLYAAQNKTGKVLESAAKVLTSLGFIVVGAADSSQRCNEISKWGLPTDLLVETFLHLQAAFSVMGAEMDSARAHQYAKRTYKILVGEDDSFKDTYGSSLINIL